MANNFRVKMGEIDRLTVIHCLGIPKQIGMSHIAISISKGSMSVIWLHRVKML